MITPRTRDIDTISEQTIAKHRKIKSAPSFG
jgi:hypothetical protein